MTKSLRGFLRRPYILFFICLLVCPVAGSVAAATSPDVDYAVPPANLEPPPWPEWVLRHWVWENEGTSESLLQLVDDYIAHDIPVGAVIVDAPWETGYNTFEWNPEQYPDPAGLVDSLHSIDVRVFIWITCMINVDSPNYGYALENGFFLNNGRTVEWWRGEGSFIDYTNPYAMEYWHGLMDGVLALGIDGWKCDGTDPYVWLLGVPWGYGGFITPREYSNYFYRDFFYYTREVLGNDRVITARPVDSFYRLVDYVFAPTDANYAGWVGDQDPNFFGLKHALHNMFQSADEGFINFGSDIGGFRGDGKRNKNVFIRWTQLGAFCPVMENGGGGEHRPWMYDEETLEIYRRYVKLHHILIPYLYSQGAESHELGIPLMRPQPGLWQYKLGDHIFVSAITANRSWKYVLFPEGNDWIDVFTGEEYAGGSLTLYSATLDRYPAFYRKGGIIPLAQNPPWITGPAGAGGRETPLTILVFPDGEASFRLYEEDSGGAEIRYFTGEKTSSLEISAIDRRTFFLLKGTDKPANITDARGNMLSRRESVSAMNEDHSWFYDQASKSLWINPGDEGKGIRLRIY